MEDAAVHWSLDIWYHSRGGRTGQVGQLPQQAMKANIRMSVDSRVDCDSQWTLGGFPHPWIGTWAEPRACTTLGPWVNMGGRSPSHSAGAVGRLSMTSSLVSSLPPDAGRKG